jgi:uncharacterized protein YkwD
VCLVIKLAIIVVLLALMATFLDTFIFRQKHSHSLISPSAALGSRIHIQPMRRVANTDTRQMERTMLQMINFERQKHRVEARFARPLSWDDSVATVAREYSADMAQRNFFGHVNPEGEDHARRLQRRGISTTASAENVSKGFPTVEATMAAFMNEPRYQQNHRGNILNPLFTHVGIGIVPDPSGGLIVTQNYVRR